MKTKTTQYNAIDIFKFICAILVCTIHLTPFPYNAFKYSESINFYFSNCIARIAVPFYFTTAGFFLFKKTSITNINQVVIKDYCFKLLRLFATWHILLFVGENSHLWYLSASVIAILFITFLLKKKVKLKYLIIISIFLFAIGLLGDTYYQIIKIAKSNNILNYIIMTYEKYFKTTKNGLFFGTIFVLIGLIFATKKIKINFKVAYIGLLISYILLMIETTFLSNHFNPKDYNMYISIVPLIFFTFYMLLNIKLKDRPIYKKLRILSTLIYFSHRMFIYFTSRIIRNLYYKHAIDLSNYRLIITILLTISFAILIEELSKTKKLKFLKYLYS